MLTQVPLYKKEICLISRKIKAKFYTHDLTLLTGSVSQHAYSEYLIQDYCTGNLLLQPLCHRDVGFWGVPGCTGGCAHNFSTKGPQDVHLLIAHLLRHYNDTAVALHGSTQRQPNA